MKTYIVEENYGDSYRVTIEDTDALEVNTHGINGEGLSIRFYTPETNYDNTTIAAFNRIQRVYLEGADIEKKDYHTDQVAKAEAVPALNATWSRV